MKRIIGAKNNGIGSFLFEVTEIETGAKKMIEKTGISRLDAFGKLGKENEEILLLNGRKMTDRQNAFEEIKQKVKWSQKFPDTGGQRCGTTNLHVTLICEEIDFEITIGFFRSTEKNKKLAYTLFELALEECFR